MELSRQPVVIPQLVLLQVLGMVDPESSIVVVELPFTKQTMSHSLHLVVRLVRVKKRDYTEQQEPIAHFPKAPLFLLVNHDLYIKMAALLFIRWIMKYLLLHLPQGLAQFNLLSSGL
jgi:hypothetical protein